MKVKGFFYKELIQAFDTQVKSFISTSKTLKLNGDSLVQLVAVSAPDQKLDCFNKMFFRRPK